MPGWGSVRGDEQTLMLRVIVRTVVALLAFARGVVVRGAERSTPVAALSSPLSSEALPGRSLVLLRRCRRTVLLRRPSSSSKTSSPGVSSSSSFGVPLASSAGAALPSSSSASPTVVIVVAVLAVTVREGTGNIYLTGRGKGGA